MLLRRLLLSGASATSNLLLIIGSIMAERFLYLPSIGFAGCLVAGVFALSRRLLAEDARHVGWAMAALAVVVAASASD